jgi:hypothetical protein
VPLVFYFFEVKQNLKGVLLFRQQPSKNAPLARFFSPSKSDHFF